MANNTVIHWFRQDLRLTDNPALFAAAQAGKILPIYILDDKNAGDHAMGAASRWWLHHSLTALHESLKKTLHIFLGKPEEILPKLIQEHNVNAVFWNRCYEPWCIQRDQNVKGLLKDMNVEVSSFNGSLLWEPWQIKKKDGGNYKVFTPFYRKGCLQALPPREPLSAIEPTNFYTGNVASDSINALNLLPSIAWDKVMRETWEIGEAAALGRLEEFIDYGLSDYKEGRNFPAKHNVSRLSPHLHFGELSPNQAWYAVKQQSLEANVDCFMSELGWREFSYSLLYYYPDLPIDNLQKKFNAFPWLDDKEALSRWQKGMTGYPIVDAGMRELWQTGYMHNRVRMIVGSFLVKNLLLHWHYGEKWFWDCLVDADLASNSASWQWVAGCGADAAPYFRVFNPVTQGEKFDPDGEYTLQYVPELSNLPRKYLYKPWEASTEILQAAGVILGKTYPKPIVDIKESRLQALNAFASIKNIPK